MCRRGPNSIASMDRVVQTEFKKRYPMILSRAIASTLIKTYAQYYAQQELGDLGGNCSRPLPSSDQFCGHPDVDRVAKGFSGCSGAVA